VSDYVTGDFDRDGLVDVAFSKEGTVYLELGSGQFFSQNLRLSNSYFDNIHALRDLNGDGLLDVIKNSDAGFDNIDIWYANGVGSWVRGPLAIYVGGLNSWRFRDSEPVDFNNDGRVDILAPSRSSDGKVLLLQQTATGGLQAFHVTFSLGGGQVVDIAASGFGDVTGDGEEDAVFISNGSQCIDTKLVVYKKGAVNYPYGIASNLRECIAGFVVGDYDGDRVEDILVATATELQLIRITDTGTELQTTKEVLTQFSNALSTEISGPRPISLFDPSAIHGVLVRLVSSGGQEFTTLSNLQGEFEFKGIPAGTYSISGTRDSFVISAPGNSTVVATSDISGVELTALSIPEVPVGDVPANNPSSDPGFHALWGLKNVAQTGGAAAVDIRATEAWQFGQGDPNLIVAVLDDGVHFDHPDLISGKWINTREVPNNGIDDDQNGVIDDISGVDIVDGNAAPEGLGFHGSHVAGTIAASADNGIGMVGVSPKVKILSVRVLGDGGSGSWSTILAGIEYVRRLRERGENVRVINASLGGSIACPAAYTQVFDRLNALGVVFVAAAGNEAEDNDQVPNTPANCASENIISVASLTSVGQLSSFSNYGVNKVHVAAPGSDILSTWPNGTYSTISGTSMAAPHVAGVAALMLSRNPALRPLEVRTIMMDSVTPLESLVGKIRAPGIVNAGRAVELSAPIATPPPQPTPPVATPNPTPINTAGFRFVFGKLTNRTLPKRGGLIKANLVIEGARTVASISLQAIELKKLKGASKRVPVVQAQTAIQVGAPVDAATTLKGGVRVVVPKKAKLPQSRSVRVVITLLDGRTIIQELGTVRIRDSKK
jgi:subtilisin family serine protease